MTWYADQDYSFGGAGLMKVAYDKLSTAGWALVESEESRSSEFSAEPIVQATYNTDPDMDVTVGYGGAGSLQLPIFMVADNAAVLRDSTTGAQAAEGVDYSWSSKARGILTINATAFWSGATSVVLPAGGYSLRGGWLVLSSAGENSQEDLKIGMRLSAVGSPSAPIKTGIRFCLFRAWNAGSSAWTDSLSGTLRNVVETDLHLMVHPTFTGKYHCSANADRLFLHSESAWDCYARVGSFRRVRSSSEQECILGMIGSQGNAATDEVYSPVAQTSSSASTADRSNIGTVWLFDQGRFADALTPVDLNANYWSREASVGYTPSQRPDYFHLADVAPGRNLDQVASTQSMLYGVWDGLKAILKSSIAHKDRLLWKGNYYTVLRCQSAPPRFIAVKEE